MHILVDTVCDCPPRVGFIAVGDDLKSSRILDSEASNHINPTRFGIGICNSSYMYQPAKRHNNNGGGAGLLL